jgi:hypothetical protein
VAPVLGLVVLLQTWGMVAWTLRAGTPVGTLLFIHLRWSEAHSLLLERGLTALAVSGAVLALLARPLGLRLAGGALSGLWMAALAAAEWRTGGAPFTDLALPAHATRIAAPVLLALGARSPGAVLTVLRWAVASTFLIHGVESLALHPRFVDFLLVADVRLFHTGMSEEAAGWLLRLIGAHDVALAVLVVARRASPAALAWMAFWGAVTAGARVVQGGEAALHHALIRAANAGLPLALLLLSHSPQRTLMSLLPSARPGARRLARAALPLLPLLLLALPLAGRAQALSGALPGHLRVVWTEDPARRATVSWSTAAAGTTHEVYLDTQPRGGDLARYAQRVAAGKNGAYVSGGAASYHHAELTGLQPATTYHFVVVSDGRASPERHFVTAPADDRPFRLLGGGDSRTGLAERKRMNQVIASLVTKDPGIVALAHGGDYNDASSSWSEWNGWLADHALTFTAAGRVLPIIPARGNHEGDGAFYDRVFGFPGGTTKNYWTTRLGEHVRFIVLDSEATMGGTQQAWLESQLQEAQGARWIVPSYHRPAYPAVKEAGGAKQFWVPLFEKYGVDVVCESDGHVLKRTPPIRADKVDPAGVVYVGEGGLGVPQRTPISAWYLKAPGMAKSAHHVQMFSFSPTELVYEAYSINGGVEDRYVFKPRRTPASTVKPLPAAPQVASVAARSPTRVAVTFSTDVEAASAAATGAYRLSPDAGVQNAVPESARTVVLTTGALEPGRSYQLTVTGVRSADGAAMAAAAQASFTAPAADVPPADPVDVPYKPEQPVAGNPGTGAPGTDAPGTDVESGGETLTGEASAAGSGCTTGAGGTLLWAALASLGLAARRRSGAGR